MSWEARVVTVFGLAGTVLCLAGIVVIGRQKRTDDADHEAWRRNKLAKFTAGLVAVPAAAAALVTWLYSRVPQ
jgi:hypothetical protein